MGLLGEAPKASGSVGPSPPGGPGGAQQAVADHGCGTPAAGILWNLSSSDHLKDRLARDTLEQLTDLVLSPLSGAGGPPLIQQNASEAEIFYNATGFLRWAGEGTVSGYRPCWQPGAEGWVPGAGTLGSEVGMVGRSWPGAGETRHRCRHRRDGKLTVAGVSGVEALGAAGSSDPITPLWTLGRATGRWAHRGTRASSARSGDGGGLGPRGTALGRFPLGGL